MEEGQAKPPTYTQEPQDPPPQDDQAPPSYHESVPTDTASGAVPYRPFPAVMNGYYYMTGIKTFFLCGATRSDRLFIVELHTGFSRKPPLGLRPGILLRNGTNPKDPIIAAAGDESQWASRAYAFNSATYVFLPPLEPRASICEMDEETMRAVKSDDGSVAFMFSIEVGEKQQRERFEWVKLKKGDDEEAKSGGFKLVQVSNRHGRPRTSPEDEGPSSSRATTEERETLALLSWSSGLSKMTHAFSLQLKGSARSMGDRWALMVVITTLRLWQMNVQGRTSKVSIAVEGKLRGG
ncbi:hypothetical protein CPLU01_07424 [Colletotrichum plurivorum]|uniref:Uncharacterized protein n=1 Tax=Colletotrichum plurivorum TaxID=2175906 RepID=A0A8H6KF67_9PEZI|nr:hypothetical protein CPLU01_07424 [Colletotrichum plurivorum]